MRKLLIPVLAICAGWHPLFPGALPAAAPGRATLSFLPGAEEVGPQRPLDLAALWDLGLANNPELREAQAEVDAARARWVQAGKYPNPRLAYTEELLGNRQAPPGALTVQVNQEVVTAGKRRLEMAAAARGTDAASLALIGRRFDVLTRIRRDYYDFLAARHTLRVQEETLADLRQGLEATRRLVEEVRTRPRTDLLRLQVLVQEASAGQARTRINVEAAWRQLAADVGLPDLSLPDAPTDLPEQAPSWEADAVVRRVLAANTELSEAAVEAGRARLEFERARAEVVPNVTVGGGYSHDFLERAEGGVVSVEMALPVWDRNQGRIAEAQARWVRAQAAQGTAATRLRRDTAEAFGRYDAARQQLQRLRNEVLPPLVESVELLRRGYRAGSADVTFADVLLAEQSLNEARLRVAEARRDLWRAVADLQGLMQLDVGEDLCGPTHPGS